MSVITTIFLVKRYTTFTEEVHRDDKLKFSLLYQGAKLPIGPRPTRQQNCHQQQYQETPYEAHEDPHEGGQGGGVDLPHALLSHLGEIDTCIIAYNYSFVIQLFNIILWIQIWYLPHKLVLVSLIYLPHSNGNNYIFST